MKNLPTRGRLLDIGTGGGFPGIPLKVMRPNQPMVLIDSVRKKITFVKSAIRQLRLDGIEALHTRAEDLWRQNADVREFEVIVCRALADLDAVVQMSMPLLSEKGCIVAYHGPHGGSQSPNGRLNLVLKGRQLHFRLSTVAYPLPFIRDNRCVSILKIV